MKDPRLGKWLFLLLKTGFAGVILGFLYFKAPPGWGKILNSLSPAALLSAGFCFILQTVLTFARWDSLLRAAGIRLPFSRICSLGMQGLFFSLFLPGGAVGGDVVKGAILARESPAGRKFNAAFSILMDRMTGMAGLFLAALLCGIPFWRSLPARSLEYRLLFWGLNLICAAGLAAFAAVFCSDALFRVPVFASLLKKLDSWTNNTFSNAADAIRVYRRAWKCLVLWVLLSGGVLFTLLAAGLGIIAASVQGEPSGKISPGVCLLAADLANTAATLPVTPGGLGTRDYTMQLVLRENGHTGEKEAKAASALYSIFQVLLSLCGAFFFAFSRGRMYGKAPGTPSI